MHSHHPCNGPPVCADVPETVCVSLALRWSRVRKRGRACSGRVRSERRARGYGGASKWTLRAAGHWQRRVKGNRVSCSFGVAFQIRHVTLARWRPTWTRVLDAFAGRQVVAANWTVKASSLFCACLSVRTCTPAVSPRYVPMYAREHKDDHQRPTWLYTQGFLNIREQRDFALNKNKTRRDETKEKQHRPSLCPHHHALLSLSLSRPEDLFEFN